jgi:hypothetical protein
VDASVPVIVDARAGTRTHGGADDDGSRGAIRAVPCAQGATTRRCQEGGAVSKGSAIDGDQTVAEAEFSGST